MNLETLGIVIGHVIGTASSALLVIFAFHTTFAQAFVIAIAYEGIINQLRKG
jgi:zinc transporter ZupT